MFFYYIKDAPKLVPEKLEVAASSKFFDKDGNLIADLGKEHRELLEVGEISEQLIDGITSIEDQRFYKHHGFDLIRILASAFHNLIHSSTQGGSTLTQQLVKLSYFSTKASDQTLKRKAQEAWLAIQLERRSSKSEILTYYANKVYMGNGIYGMKTAAKSYYKKEIKDLTLSQAALLAGIPQAPSEYSPYNNPESAKKRRDLVLFTMLDEKKITHDEYEAAKNTNIDDGLQELKEDIQDFKQYDPYLVEVIKEVKEKTGKNVWTDGLNVYTNIDSKAQERLYNIVNTSDYVNFPDEEMQIAATLIEVQTGKVRAQIGGRNIPENISLGSNRATQNDRDWGSTMKPMVDYGPAIEYLHYSTAQIFNDSKYSYPGTQDQIYDWDLKYMGLMTMRRALVESRNVPAVRALEAVGLDKAKEFLSKIGINYPRLFYANAISSSMHIKDDKQGVSSLRIAAAYAAFANNGVFNQPYYIEKIVYNDGVEETYKPKASRAMEAVTAYMITDMLKGVLVTETGTSAKTPGLFEAGKTGTSNYSDEDLKKDADLTAYADRNMLMAPDESFVGYTLHYSLSVWSGYDNRLTPVFQKDFHVVADVYRQLMSYAMKQIKNNDWEKPDDVIKYGSELYLKNSPGYVGGKSTPKYSYTVPSSTVSSTTSSATDTSSTNITESADSSSSLSEEP
ncbi:MAG: PBP1A family penicillin-binding protein [Streptococcaceae bacterium]|nr:PBP1A family penicillin-binding protein [Streptococcaceae bacterium]